MKKKIASRVVTLPVSAMKSIAGGGGEIIHITGGYIYSETHTPLFRASGDPIIEHLKAKADGWVATNPL